MRCLKLNVVYAFSRATASKWNQSTLYTHALILWICIFVYSLRGANEQTKRIDKREGNVCELAGSFETGISTQIYPDPTLHFPFSLFIAIFVFHCFPSSVSGSAFKMEMKKSSANSSERANERKKGQMSLHNLCDCQFFTCCIEGQPISLFFCSSQFS